MSLASELLGPMPGDSRLTELAQRKYPLAGHWWGVRVARRAPPAWRAFCYLDDTVMAEWVADVGISIEARDAVLKHRLERHSEQLLTVRTPGGRRRTPANA